MISHYTDTTPSIPVLYEDEHLLIIRKPAGVLSQPDHSGDRDVLSLCRRHVYGTNSGNKSYLGLLHRLDRPVAGIMMLAKRRDSAKRLSEQIRNHLIQKSYKAVVLGSPAPNGVLQHYLKKNSSRNMVKTVPKGESGGRFAELAYERLQTRKNLSLLEIHLMTGRPHQIRVQLAAEGYPIWGDSKYGRNPSTGAIALFADKITFYHPETDREQSITAPLPSGIPWSYFQ